MAPTASVECRKKGQQAKWPNHFILCDEEAPEAAIAKAVGVSTGSPHPPCVREQETLTAAELRQAGPAGVRQAPDGVGEKRELGVTREAAEGHCGAHTEALLVFGVPSGLSVAHIWQRPTVPCGKINGDLAGLLLLLLYPGQGTHRAGGKGWHREHRQGQGYGAHTGIWGTRSAGREHTQSTLRADSEQTQSTHSHKRSTETTQGALKEHKHTQSTCTWITHAAMDNPHSHG